MIISNNKGITPVIAIILLLMMTIAITGLAYTWLQRTQTSIQTSTENTTEELLRGLKVSLKVEGYNITCASSLAYIRAYGRNAGTKDAKNIQLYLDDALVSGASNASWAAGNTTSWLLVNGIACSNYITKTQTIKISSDETSAEKSFAFSCTTGSC